MTTGERPGFEGGQDVIEDEIIACLILCEPGIEFLDGGLFVRIAQIKPELRMPKDDLVVKGAGSRLRPRIDAMTHRAALHENDRVVTVLARHRRRQTKHVTGFRLPSDRFEAHRGDMMAFINDNMPVIGHQIGHLRRFASGSEPGRHRLFRSASSFLHG